LSQLQLNCQLEQAGFAARLNIGKCLLVVRKESTQKQQTHKVKPSLDKKNCAIDFCMLKNQEFPPLSDSSQKGMS